MQTLDTKGELMEVESFTHQQLDEYAAYITEALDEAGKSGEIGIRWIVYKRGINVINRTIKAAIDLYETGPLIKDGSRKRTFGGCFFVCYPQVRRSMKVPMAWPYGKPNDLVKPEYND